MLETVSTAKTAQFTLAASFPERAKEAPARVLPLEFFWERNLSLDAVFYDVSSITTAETEAVADQTQAGEGSVLVVPPPGKGELKIYPSIQAFADAGGGSVKALCVAGVGSSALGAAALARNVASAIDAPVATVVSGYGYSDVASEALGGWFWFGTVNRLRHGFEVLDQAMSEPPAKWALEGAVVETEAQTLLSKYSLDTYSVLQLLGDPQFDFDLLVGHSKGNLVISEALYALDLVNPERLAAVGAKTRIVTISARIAMPPGCDTVIDVIGAVDALGELNSTPGIQTDIPVFGAGHYTNTQLFGHLDVAEAVRKALVFKP